MPQGKSEVWDEALERGVPEVWNYHQFMTAYGWIPPGEYEGLPLLLRLGLVLCMNTEAKIRESKSGSQT